MAAIRERKDQNGKVSYQAQVRIQGYPPQSKTFLRKTDAKQWAIQTETEIRTGMTIRKSTASKHTVREMLERYRDNVLIDKANGGKDHKTHIAWWIDELGHYALSEVTTDLVTRSMDKLKKSKTRLGKSPAPATVLRYLMALSHAFNVARKQWNWCESSPVENVQRPKVKNERTRYLTDAEREALLHACKNSPNADLYLVVLLAISTGMRKGEIMGMRWQDIHTAPDQSFTRVHLTKTKNDKARSVLLTSPALELLEERRTKLLDSLQAKTATGLIFPSMVNVDQPVDLRKPWGSALETAGIDGFRFHDLRHTTASYLAMNGASLLSISKVLGHKTTKMTERYSHLATSHIDEIVRSMNEKKFGSTANETNTPDRLAKTPHQ
ncbi:tyrosine-type recombinase/integrase [Comamonas terrigena]|uniref:tyrosine-type recombinase/integrase n=1 Tax=Comamonas terrigena TaxID=32013 RepID=UPI00244A569E|nr:site-specific integrase [Comamonas terrigena]MDH1502610.1 site-specific integrase [Comamonas terrigena]